MKKHMKLLTASAAVIGLLGASVAFGQDGAAGLTDSIGEQFKAYILLAIQLITAVAFLVVGYGVVTKFISAVSGKSEWGEVVVPVVFGAAILIVTAYMFAEATTAANAIGGTASLLTNTYQHMA